MKKFTSVLFLVAIISVAFAQERISIQGEKFETSHIFAKNDTLAPPSFATAASFTTYIAIEDGTTDTGYVNGTNYYGDYSKVQQFQVDVPYNIFGALAWISNVEGTGGSLKFQVWNSNGSGTALSGTVNYAPGTVLGTMSVPIEDLTFGPSFPADAHTFMFNSPIWAPQDYYIGMNFQSLLPFPQNNLGIVSSTSGSAGMMELAWEQWSNNAWYSLQGAGWDNGAMDVDLMIFPIVDMTSSVQDNFISGMIANIFPNPTSDVATIEFNLKNKAENVNIMVLDINGKLISSYELGAQNAGVNSFSFDVSNFAAGSYFYTIQADRNRFAKVFIVK